MSTIIRIIRSAIESIKCMHGGRAAGERACICWFNGWSDDSDDDPDDSDDDSEDYDDDSDDPDDSDDDPDDSDDDPITFLAETWF